MISSVSIVLTVHNKDFLLGDVVRGLAKNSSPLVKELIVVFDGCTDGSESVFESIVSDLPGRSFEIRKLATPDVWETRANNEGLKRSRCDASILVQDDMVVTEKDFDMRLVKPINAYEDVFAVTGRTAHNDVIVDGDLSFSDEIGRENPSGRRRPKLERKLRKFFRVPERPRREIFGVRDVVNRGPLLIDNDRLRRLDFLDEEFAPLDLDDHDLCFRAFKTFGWVCGSYPVGYVSDLSWGTTRHNPKSHEVWTKSNAKNKKLIISRHYELLVGEKHAENRILR